MQAAGDKRKWFEEKQQRKDAELDRLGLTSDQVRKCIEASVLRPLHPEDESWPLSVPCRCTASLQHSSQSTTLSPASHEPCPPDTGPCTHDSRRTGRHQQSRQSTALKSTL